MRNFFEGFLVNPWTLSDMLKQSASPGMGKTINLRQYPLHKGPLCLSPSVEELMPCRRSMVDGRPKQWLRMDMVWIKGQNHLAGCQEPDQTTFTSPCGARGAYLGDGLSSQPQWQTNVWNRLPRHPHNDRQTRRMAKIIHRNYIIQLYQDRLPELLDGFFTAR